jgi:ribosome recycling factor
MDSLKRDLEQKARQALEGLREELRGLRTNRPSPSLVEDIEVEYAGSRLRIREMGTIAVLPPRDLQVTFWDKTAVAPAAKAIQESPLRLSPVIDGMTLRLKLPALTEERRTELTRLVKSTAEKVKIKVRGLREDAMKQVEAAFKAKEIGEDQKFKTKESVQKVVESLNRDIESAVETKVKEVME